MCSEKRYYWVALGEPSHKMRTGLSPTSKHRHAKRARVIFFGDRSIRRTVHSNDFVEFFWVVMYSKKETGNI